MTTFDNWVERARQVRIETEITRRGIKLRGKIDRSGPCPRCGGNDRFAVNVKKQVWNCRGCGVGGDVVDLVRHVDGIDFRAAVDLLVGGTTEPMPVAAPPPRPRGGNDAWRRIWREGAPITRTLAELYLSLTRRLGVPSDPDGDALRFHPRCLFDGTHHPCLLGLYRDLHTDAPTGIVRIWLTDQARKIDRRALGRVAGSAVKLTADEEVTYGVTIGEGLETTLGGMALGFRPAWSVGSDAGIRKFPVLAGIDSLTILVDRDAADARGRRAGPDAAEECSARWTAAGREVRLVVPRALGADIADIAGRAS